MSKQGVIQQAYRELDALARSRYGISGSQLLAKLEKGESGRNGKAVSKAGARAWFQFMPGTRADVIRKYGIDPWRSEKEARDAAVLHLTGKLGHAKGLEGYNPGGGAGYVRYILSQPAGGPVRLNKGVTGRRSESYGVKAAAGRERGGNTQDVEGAIVDTLLSGAKPQKLGATVLQKLAYDPKYAKQPRAKTYKAGPGKKEPSVGESKPPRGAGIATFDGKPVAAWIAAELRYARRHGWKGTVSSGFRTRADQTRIYNSGVRPAAKPGTSNHEGAEFPRGAVDVTEPEQLAAILEKRGSPLKWAGAKDRVHFSHPHGGSY